MNAKSFYKSVLPVAAYQRLSSIQLLHSARDYEVYVAYGDGFGLVTSVEEVTVFGVPSLRLGLLVGGAGRVVMVPGRYRVSCWVVGRGEVVVKRRGG